MRKAKKLTSVERDQIEILLAKGYSMRSIARVLGRGHNTVSYEINTNGGIDGYNAKNAQLYTSTHLKNRRLQWSKIESDKALKKYVVSALQAHWNPDEIAGAMRRDKLSFYVSKTAIYEWLYSPRGQPYCKYLYSNQYSKKPHSKKHERTLIPNRTSIDNRFLGATNRTRFGHMEIDTIVSKRGTHGGLSVLSERKSRLVLVQKVQSMSATEHVMVHKKLLKQVQTKSVTFDNGIENIRHQQLGVSTFFCDPYSSWQKGGVENANKMIRRYFPKRTDFSVVSQKEIDHIVSIINDKPRKVLKYRSALEVAKGAGII